MTRQPIKTPKTIHLIAAARPNFMKIAPLYHALAAQPWADPLIVHTGQHYDINMSDAFFMDLKLPEPHVHLGVGSGTHAQQTGKVMIAYEQLIMENRPDLVVVVGDVNSTVAATMAAAKLGVKVAHLEAGLRSYDRTMPEEINRVLTDAIADLLWTPSVDGDQNLIKEGIVDDKIEMVGNIMIDSLEMMRPKIEAQDTCESMDLVPGRYGVITLHRPSNVDHADTLKSICGALGEISNKIPLVFPVHPRTAKCLDRFALNADLGAFPDIQTIDPISYVPFMNLVFNARLVITDSGGIQEETTYLGIPCLTLRPNTERPITVSQGTNRLTRPELLGGQVAEILNGHKPSTTPPALWDGHTAERVVDSIRTHIGRQR